MPKQKPKQKPKTKKPDIGAEGLQEPGVGAEDLQEPGVGAEGLQEPGAGVGELDMGYNPMYIRLKYGIEYLKLQYFGRGLFRNLSRAYKAWSLDQTIVLDPVFKNIEKLDLLKDIEKFESVLFPEIERFLASKKEKK
jgi:hypothetical protein